MSEMFCFQCEQTIGCSGCTMKAGACGKSAEVANLQDELTGALVALASAVQDGKVARTDELDQLFIEGLFTTVTNVDFDADAVQALIDRVHAAGAGSVDVDYDMLKVWNAQEDVRSLKSLILFGLRGTSAYASHALVLGYRDREATGFFYEGLALVGSDADADTLLAGVLKEGETNIAIMKLLDQANTESFGTPQPATVELSVEPGPFIIVSGHDLGDLKMLLDQVKGTGVNVYTHSEMLPAHGYPELAAYDELKGNFGSAWQNQRKEFDGVPAPILFTTNCLMPPAPSYADRVFTTGEVQFPDTPHIDPDAQGHKDFSALIARAKELGGYETRQERTGANGGSTVMTGFGHAAILSHAGEVVEAVKQGAISHFFLVGGCDGARKERDYYTQLVKQAPSDSIILTLACGKYRFNDLDLGTIGGLPRIMDMGQCNDAYGAVQVALDLADAFNCGVNDLPLTLVLSWYEQKAVCILLSLLSLGIKNIYLGPTLPAFVSPGVLNKLVEAYQLTPTSTPEADLEKILA